MLNPLEHRKTAIQQCLHNLRQATHTAHSRALHPTSATTVHCCFWGSSLAVYPQFVLVKKAEPLSTRNSSTRALPVRFWVQTSLVYPTFVTITAECSSGRFTVAPENLSWSPFKKARYRQLNNRTSSRDWTGSVELHFYSELLFC